MRGAAFRTMLFVQWKLQRAELLGLAVVAALIAPLSMWTNAQAFVDSGQWLTNLENSSDLIRILAASLATIAGALLAVRPFALDGRARHTYALALPVQRSDYALMRAASGFLLALIPAIGFLIGAIVAAQGVPETLVVRKFPFELTLRFLLALSTAFVMFFGIQYGLGGRTRRWILLALLTVLGVEVFSQFTLRASVVGAVVEVLRGSFSPIRVFLDRWVLFGV
jgi:hypothetical protein